MVKSPGSSPDTKKAKLDVFPDLRKELKPKNIEKAEVEQYVAALSKFQIPKEDDLKPSDECQFRCHPDKDVEGYFVASAMWGVPALSWDIVRPVFLWKLEFVINEFRNCDNEQKRPESERESPEKPDTPVKNRLSVLGKPQSLIRAIPVPFDMDEAIEFILNKAKSFDGFPFTWQRICELLSTPKLHYNRCDKFVRAVDKVINVVTTISEWGNRTNGDWEIPMDSSEQHIENVFFGVVDEVEAMEKAQVKSEADTILDEPLDMSVKEEANEKEEASEDEPKKEEVKKKEEVVKVDKEPEGDKESEKASENPEETVEAVENASTKEADPQNENISTENVKKEEKEKEVINDEPPSDPRLRSAEEEKPEEAKSEEEPTAQEVAHVCSPSKSRETLREAARRRETFGDESEEQDQVFLRMLYPFGFLVFSCIFAPVRPSRSETKLFTDLLKGYNPLERPVRNASSPVIVKIKLFLQQILDVDEKNQIVSINAWLSYTWFDYKLQWIPQKYAGIQDIRFPGSADHIWKPDVLLYNSAAEDFDSTFKSNLLVYHTGTVVWIPPGVLKFVCPLDVTWFPFDDQVCEMKFGSWTFHGNAIDLQIDDDTNGTHSMDLSTYLVNGEWQIISTNAVRHISYYKCCPEPYPTVNYYLHIRRRTLYYGFNLIIPSLLISLMAILGFMFPPDAGEKITLEVTILLAIVFFLSMVSEMTPPTSEAVPLIGVFFSCCMLVVSASVVFTIVVLNLHFRSAETHEMNPMVRRILLELLPWLLFMSRPGYKYVNASVIDHTDKLPKHLPIPLNPELPTENNGQEAHILLLHSVHRELRKVVAFYMKEDRDERIQSDWRFAAMVVDRACLLIFTVFIVVSILSIILSAPHLIA
ncbi:unnamed protein product [Caenorhabditis bovis]|uniref:Uncharacterized protein n=1 Tax=Caenorhabditis bovis TaxID=2654633 RepID=A0A8S1F5I3_9PELO|nr:unnamed protein product [Caenorhabditis bovis]